MDAAYLRSNVSDALSQGLAATLVAQPDDPVEYLGRYLLKYVERKEAEEKVRDATARRLPRPFWRLLFLSFLLNTILLPALITSRESFGVHLSPSCCRPLREPRFWPKNPLRLKPVRMRSSKEIDRSKKGWSVRKRRRWSSRSCWNLPRRSMTTSGAEFWTSFSVKLVLRACT